MKEHEKHIIDTGIRIGNNTKNTWCGKTVLPFEWAFMDIDHAVNTYRYGSRLVICPECLDKILHTLRRLDD